MYETIRLSGDMAHLIALKQQLDALCVHNFIDYETTTIYVSVKAVSRERAIKILGMDEK